MDRAGDALAPVRDLLPGTRLDHADLLSDGERSTVHRVRARDDDGGERTLIVKQFRGAGEQWVRECAALACLPPDAPAPRLVAECADPRIAVLSDLGGPERGRGIADPLLGDDPVAAAGALSSWARALAALHGATAGLHDEFAAQLAARSGELPVVASPSGGELRSAMATLDRIVGSLGVATPPGTADQLDELVAGVDSGACAVTPHDTCPDNCVEVDGQVALIDFEGARWRNVAWDLAYLLVPWPTCWCCWRLAEPAARQAVEDYREHARQALPHVATDRFEADLQVAVVGWALESVVLLTDAALGGGTPDLGKRRPTPPRRAKLLHRLDTAAATTALPALAELSGRLAQELRGRWQHDSAEDLDLPFAPAFRP